MIQAVLRLVAPAGVRDEIADVIRGLVGPTEASKGCHLCRVFRDAGDKNTLTYWVLWETREGLEAHFRSPRFRQLLPYIEMSIEPPQVDVSNVERLGGLEIMVAAIGVEPDAPHSTGRQSR